MKYHIYLILLFFIIFDTSSQCKKDKSSSPLLEQLPPISQEGKNTLGFLLNGQPWTPAGNNGTANLSVNVDVNYKHGTFNISANRITSDQNRQSIGLGISDSLNFQSVPITLILGKQTLFGLSFIIKYKCSYDFFENTVYRCGQLNISKFDKTNRIISGTFNATLFKANCGDSIKITNGRFDMKY